MSVPYHVKSSCSIQLMLDTHTSSARDMTFQAIFIRSSFPTTFPVANSIQSIQLNRTWDLLCEAEGVEIALMGSLPRHEAGAIMTMGSVLFRIYLLPTER